MRDDMDSRSVHDMNTTWTLKGITAARGACDHCGRTLARLFRVTSPEGVEMVVGRTCAANLTGYNWSMALAMRVEARRLVKIATEARYGDLYREAVALSFREAAASPNHVTGTAGEVVFALESNSFGEDIAREWLATARNYLAVRAA